MSISKLTLVMLLDLDLAKRVSRIFDVLSSETRLFTLSKIEASSLPEIARQCDINRASLQRHLDILLDVGFVQREKRSYALTDAGKFYLKNVVDKVVEWEREKSDLDSIEAIRKTIRSGLISKDQAQTGLMNALKSGTFKSPLVQGEAKKLLKEMNRESEEER